MDRVTSRDRLLYSNRELATCARSLPQLLYLEALTGSTDKEDVEAANQLQSMLYYDSAILDASIAVISDFKTQSYR